MQPARLPLTVPAAGAVIVVLVALTATAPGALLPAAELRPYLIGAAAVSGLALAVAGVLSWRASGRAAPLWLSTAAVASTLYQLDALRLLETGTPREAAPLQLQAAAAVVIWLALLGGALWPTIDSALRPWPMLLGGGLGVVVLAFALQAAVLLAPLVGAAGDAAATIPAPATPMLPAAWLVPAAASAVQGHRRRDPVLGWATLVALALGGAQALRAATGVPEPLLAAGLGHTTAVLAAAGGIGMSVARLASHHRNELGATAQASKAVQQRLLRADAARAELVHEVHNALSTIDAGVSTLHASHEQLSDDERTTLSEAVRDTIDRLRLLLDDTEDDPAHPVRVAEVLEPVADAARARGQSVDLAVPADLWVVAGEQSLAHTVDILLENAAKHAPDSPVALSATGQQQGVILRCDDAGPGVPVAEREHVFLSGHRGRGANGAGQGLGLPLAARLVHEQGGAIWVEERRGGGASFAVWLARPEPDEGQAAASAGEMATCGGSDGG